MSLYDLENLMVLRDTKPPTHDEAKKLMRGSQLAEFYAGWNAGIRAVQAVADAQGWWFPDSVNQLLVDEPPLGNAKDG